MTTQNSQSVNSFSLCGRPLRGFIPLLMGQSGDPDNRGVVTLVVTPLKVHRVRLNLGGRPDKTVWPKRISRRKARKAGVKPNFRYKSFARKGEFCLRRHTDYDAQGRIFYRSFQFPPCGRQQKSRSEHSEAASSAQRWRSRGYVRGFARATR